MTADNLVKTGNVPAGAQAGPFGTRWWRNWFDHSPDAQFVLDTAGIVECNAQALRVLGRVDKSRILGREPASLSPETQPDGSRSDAGIAGRYGRPDLTVKFDWVHVSFDGAELPVEVAVTPIDFEGRRLWLVTWHDIGDRQAALRRLAEEKAAADQANQTKSEFLATMSHEIRTPMNGVLGMVDLLLNTMLDDRQRDCAMTIRDSGTALLNIINDILDLSKMEAGKLELENEPFDPYLVIESIPQLLAPRAREKALALSTSIRRAGSSMIRGDAGRLRQILMNLVGNAIKFTHEGSVEIRADFEEIGDGRVAMKFAVRDTGIGIPKEAQRRLFSRFTQADAKTSRLFGGTGLGLSICKQICDLMGAEIGVESAESRGSTFWIKAEFDTAAEDTGVRAGPAAERPEIVPPEPNEAADTEPRGLKILLAEDNLINQKVALAMLKSGGHAVDIAENGRQAVDAVESGDYDVVLMDIHMPEMDGVAATKAIRELADPDKASITIIALTANAMAGSRETYLAAGMNEYVSKPIDVSLLNKVLGGIGGDGTASTATPVTGAPETPKAAVPKSGQDDLAELLGSLDQIAGPATEN
jgi:PAS domain S-box-containing protein